VTGLKKSYALSCKTFFIPMRFMRVADTRHR